MKILHHMRELEEALGDWERYRRLPKEQFLLAYRWIFPEP
jgi:hypothetical protein